MKRRQIALAPSFQDEVKRLLVEIVSPEQGGLFWKAQRYAEWGVEHVWVINPQTEEAYEYHGGATVIIASQNLHARADAKNARSKCPCVTRM